MEFAIDVESKVTMVPRGFARTGTTPDGSPGVTWTAKYASVGMNGLDLPFLFDGLNEAGLWVGLFYFPTSAGYMPYTPADTGRTLAPWELGSWMLENFATVAEVKAHLGDAWCRRWFMAAGASRPRRISWCMTRRAPASSSSSSGQAQCL